MSLPVIRTQCIVVIRYGGIFFYAFSCEPCVQLKLPALRHRFHSDLVDTVRHHINQRGVNICHATIS